MILLMFVVLQLLHYHTQGFSICSMSGTELHGSTTICPGNSGIFECKTTNTEQLFWIVDGTPLSIPITHTVNSGSITASGHVASLIKLSLASGNVGNRTSLLRVAPATTSYNSIVTVVCSGGDPVNTCSREINFVGTDNSVDNPTNPSMVSDPDGTVHITWEQGHTTMVSHYSIVMETRNREFNFTSFTTSKVVLNVSSSANLTTFSVCGGRSGPVSLTFEESESGTTRSTTESGSITIRSAPVIVAFWVISYVAVQ